ncbi:hypothetical protein INT45_002306 [Circinella minor]|uniref:Uncharacterized protein n=1 Tax=Circinella minor TaxID=1195481 RepID=A0A8H7SEG8_9FUNG|nr:hypothetical protein INT45_002306 [Circinella minor]
MILPALSYVPQLESLALDIESLQITISDLEELHELCPNLQQFKCSLQIQLQETESDLSPTTIHQTIQPIKTMKRLPMANTFWSDITACTMSWWGYITTNILSSRL